MKCAVRYYTKTGNTKRLAEAIANVVGVDALPISEPITEQVDILFLGNSYYLKLCYFLYAFCILFIHV